MPQRNQNSDDDIFFDMDGLDTRDSNMPEVTQSDDEDIDDGDFGMLSTHMPHGKNRFAN